MIMAVCLTLTAASCSAAPEDDGKLRIVTTVFPVYDWVRNIAEGTEVEISMLVNKGVDLHSYQPTVDDIVRISESDIFIYVGGESDRWAADIADTVSGNGTVCIDLLDVLGDSARDEETAEGMEDDEDDGDGGGKDEHVWLSLKNAEKICGFISGQLCSVNGNDRETYVSNTDSYTAKLNELDRRYEETVGNSPCRTLLFGDRFPFLYMTSDYGIEYYAAFAGCSAETEASFNTVMFLAGKADELGLKYILKTESSDGRLAETIRNSTVSKDQIILTLDSMQSVTSEDVAGGVTYIGIMEENLGILREALEQGE